MVKEIVLAIDPALKKIEEILLWKNKFKTGAVFTFFHFLFWLIQSYNIRTYCTLSCIFLLFHLLDAYRTKKRRELIRLHQNKPNVIESISSLGRYIIYVYSKLTLLVTKLSKLKQKNRLQYFIVLLVFWSMAGVVGVKIRGFYLSYFFFWIIFFVPAIIHYDVPRKILSRALPVLEQLDQSMKYERRSILDKKELLVDVKLPEADAINGELEDEYLKDYLLDESEKMKEKQRKAFENSDEEEEEEDEYENQLNKDEEDELESYDDSQSDNQFKDRENDDDEEYSEGNEEEYDDRFRRYNLNSKNVRDTKSNIRDQLDIDLEDDSLLPDEPIPHINDLTDNYNPKKASNLDNNYDLRNVISGDRVMRKKIKNRPSLLEYYANTNDSNDSNLNDLNKQSEYKSVSSNQANIPIARLGNNISGKNTIRRNQSNDRDIDESFDFLEEELIKYTN